MAKMKAALAARYCYPFGKVMEEDYTDVIIRRDPDYKTFPLVEFDMIPVEIIFRRDGVPIVLVILGYGRDTEFFSAHPNVKVYRFKDGEFMFTNYIVDPEGDIYATLFHEDFETELNSSQVLACKHEAERVWKAFLERDEDSAYEFIDDPYEFWYD